LSTNSIRLRLPAASTSRLGALRDYGIVFSFVALFIVLSAASEPFLTTTNLLNIADQWSPVGIVAVAGTVVFIAGGFDISVGAIYALAGVIAAMLTPHIGPAGGILVGMLLGVFCGFVNGLVTTAGRINPFIATLASATIIGGIATLATGGKLIIVENPSFANLGSGELLGVKYSIWIFAGFALVCGFLLSRTTFGRAAYAAGGNQEAARLSGVRVNIVKAITFTLSGFAAGVAGVLVASRVSTGQADTGGFDLAFTAISAIVIGGTSIQGGAGAVWRTLLGIFLLAMIYNGFNLLGIDTRYQEIVTGAIILGAVGVDAWARRR
jgi:ribose transport system permease protein